MVRPSDFPTSPLTPDLVQSEDDDDEAPKLSPEDLQAKRELHKQNQLTRALKRSKVTKWLTAECLFSPYQVPYVRGVDFCG